MCHSHLSSFVPVAGVGGFPLALAVSGTTPTKITKVDELVAASRAKDGVTFASGGVGSMGHLNGVRFLNVVKGQGVHVTYKNNPEGLNALMGGFTQMMFASVSEVAALRGDGKLRVLAVTAPQRSSNMPDVPTMQELGYYDFEVALWHGFVAPAGTPPVSTAGAPASSAPSLRRDRLPPRTRSRLARRRRAGEDRKRLGWSMRRRGTGC